MVNETRQVTSSSKNFFISYNGADKAWAEWIAWQLEEAGFSTILQAWDFRPGANFVLRMQEASKEAERTIAVLSPNYLNAVYTQPEWAAAFKRDPQGTKGLLVPVMVRDCRQELAGLWPQIVYIDLVGMSEQAARKALLDGIEFHRIKPKTPPSFPGTIQHTEAEEPYFPGNATNEPSSSTEILGTAGSQTVLPKLPSTQVQSSKQPQNPFNRGIIFALISFLVIGAIVASIFLLPRWNRGTVSSPTSTSPRISSAFVHDNFSSSSGSTNSVSLGVTSGDLLIVAITQYERTLLGSNPVTDDKGDQYQEVGNLIANPNQQQDYAELYYTHNAKGGPTSVTVSFNPPPPEDTNIGGNTSLGLYEYRGLGSLDPRYAQRDEPSKQKRANPEREG
jgi:TIR domain